MADGPRAVELLFLTVYGLFNIGVGVSHCLIIFADAHFSFFFFSLSFICFWYVSSRMKRVSAFWRLMNAIHNKCSRIERLADGGRLFTV